MAKMFYNNVEVQEALGKTKDQIAQMVEEGILREFVDGAKKMYKVDEVDALAGGQLGKGDGSDIGLAPEDSSEQYAITPDETVGDTSLTTSMEDSGLTDSNLAGQGSGVGAETDKILDELGDQISLGSDDSAEIELASEKSGEVFSLSPEESGPGDLSSDLPLSEGSGDQISLDDTKPGGDKDDTVVTSHGVNVLDDSNEDLELVDPMAQTQIAPDFDQVDIDSGSSGSGLLDLSREADDTSLGAELLEEIYPGAEEGVVETQVPEGLGMAAEIDSLASSQLQSTPAPETVRAVEVYDATSGAFGAMMVVPLLILVLLGVFASAQINDVRPEFLGKISGMVWYVIGGAAVLTVAVMGLGIMVTGNPAGAGKVKKEKPVKENKARKPKAKKVKKGRK